jgi:phage terminase large subunit-like protein
MNWMASNVVVQRRLVTRRLSRSKRARCPANKIDGIDALVNALAPALVAKAARAGI